MIRCNIDTDPFPYRNGVFDRVYSKCVFEHLTNPANFMKESYRVLKHGGEICIITDNAGLHGLFGKVHMGNYEKNTKYGKEDRHYSLFTPNHMKNWLEKFNFKVRQADYLDLSDDIRVKMLVLISRKFSPNIIARGIK